MFRSTRREMLRKIAAAALAGPLAARPAQHVHQAVAKERAGSGGVYQPKALTAREFSSLEMLCEMIVPGAGPDGQTRVAATVRLVRRRAA